MGRIYVASSWRNTEQPTVVLATDNCISLEELLERPRS